MGWIAAWETNKKMYGYRAWAYTITAWAFGDPRPLSSPEMIRRFKEFSSDEIIKDREEAWLKVSRKTLHGLQTEYKKRKVSKKTWQAAYQLIGYSHSLHSGNKKEKLCHALLKECESKFRGINRDSWKEGYKVLYPR